MVQLEVTSISSKGQVVIPADIRKEMGLFEGDKLMVFSDGVNVLLKPILKPKMKTFKKLIQESRRYAKAHGLTKEDLRNAVKKVRNKNRSRL